MKKHKSFLLTALLTATLTVGSTTAAAAADPEKPSGYALETITIGTTAAIETATFGEYNFDMLASGVSELPLVCQDTNGEYHPLWPPMKPRMQQPGPTPFRTA